MRGTLTLTLTVTLTARCEVAGNLAASVSIRTLGVPVHRVRCRPSFFKEGECKHLYAAQALRAQSGHLNVRGFLFVGDDVVLMDVGALANAIQRDAFWVVGAFSPRSLDAPLWREDYGNQCRRALQKHVGRGSQYAQRLAAWNMPPAGNGMWGGITADIFYVPSVRARSFAQHANGFSNCIDEFALSVLALLSSQRPRDVVWYISDRKGAKRVMWELWRFTAAVYTVEGRTFYTNTTIAWQPFSADQLARTLDWVKHTDEDWLIIHPLKPLLPHPAAEDTRWWLLQHYCNQADSLGVLQPTREAREACGRCARWALRNLYNFSTPGWLAAKDCLRLFN